MTKQYLLKPNVVIEPLVDRWYAWSHLISPATYAMNITGRHLKIMQSYIASPALHQQAVQTPKLLGGPFMDYDTDRSSDVMQLKEETIQRRQKMIEFSEAVKSLDALLQEKAEGYSLEPLYSEIPEILRGYVELVYDLHNNPSFRFFESLLYESEYYQEESQSIALWITQNDARPFSLSTPKLSGGEVVHLDIPFKSPKIDQLARLKRESASLSEISNLTGLAEDSSLLHNLLTQEPGQPYNAYTGDKVRMRYFGHACIFLETADVSILVDPLISYYGYQSDVSRFSDADLPDVIDYVLITHNHQDHVLFETLLPLRHRIKNLVIPKSKVGPLQDPSLSLMFKKLGFKNVIEIDEMETLVFDDLTLTGLPFIGEHSDLDIQAKVCHHVQIENFKMLLMADSCNIEPVLYQHIHRIMGDVDVLFLGMECDGAPLSWLYGPLMSEGIKRDQDDSRTLSGSNFDQGRSLVDVFNPRELYIYAMGQEPWTKFISTKDYTDDSMPIVESNKLIEYAESKGISSERLFGEKELFYDKELSLKHPMKEVLI